MNIRRIGILLHKELFYGARNYIVIFAVFAPIMLSIIVSLVFGTWLTTKPRLGVVDEGSSKIVYSFASLDSIDTLRYQTASEMRKAVENGSADIGIVIPAGFDDAIIGQTGIQIKAYIWGESQARNQIILGVAIANAVRELSNPQKIPVEIVSVRLGEKTSMPWNERLFPFIVLMTVFLGGLMLPSTSIAKEKETKTMRALLMTPASVQDVFIAKGILGFLLSLFMAIVILAINRSFDTEPFLLLVVLALGAVMSAELGMLLGVFVKDFTTIFTIWKSAGIILFAPAIFYLFPGMPQWIAKIFPTYYLTQPIVILSQSGGTWADISFYIFILIAINASLFFFLLFALKKKQHAAAGD